jgi:hypothetical protein
MSIRLISLSLISFLGLMAQPAWALGLQLGETKEQLKLKYDVSVTDHTTGRVTITFTMTDEGRLAPINAIDLVVPSQDGTGYVDLSISLATRKEAGKTVARIHIKKEWAERAEIHLKTSAIDGKSEPLTWYYHSIPLTKYLK